MPAGQIAMPVHRLVSCGQKGSDLFGYCLIGSGTAENIKPVRSPVLNDIVRQGECRGYLSGLQRVEDADERGFVGAIGCQPCRLTPVDEIA